MHEGDKLVAEIISTAWLAEHLHAPEQRIIDARTSFSVYEENHIPGGQFLHVETLRMTDGGVPCRMLPVPMLGIIFGRLGITVDTPVVIYSTNPADHLSATYVGWSLAVSSNQNFFLLNGDLGKWERDGYPVTQQYPDITEEYFQADFDDSVFVDWAYVFDNLYNEDTVLVDSRIRSSYTGESGPTQRRGHIPGAILHNYLWDFEQDGAYLPLETLRERYERAGITPEKEIITYCVTGREGSAVWFVLKYLLDYPRVRLYQASLTEWAAKPELPMVISSDPWGEMGKEEVA